MKPTISNHKYLVETISKKHQIESAFLELSERLYRIKTERLWADEYDTLEEFLLEMDITSSTCSKLCSIYDNWIVKGKMKVEELSGASWTNLYAAIPLLEKQNPKELAAELRLLTRQDAIERAREFVHKDCKHSDTYKILVCRDCGKKIKTYNE